MLISALGHSGDLSKADDILNKLKARISLAPEIDSPPEDIANTSYVEKTMPFTDNKFSEIYLSGLNKASFPI